MYYRQPEYYRDFHCIGSPCKFSCCIGWNIGWTKDEVSKVLDNPDCSDTLRSLMETSFEIHEGEARSHRVILSKGMRCPFLTDDNLCVIQKELGEEYLSKTCREFPRTSRLVFDANTGKLSAVYRGCRLSCPEISRRLFSDKKAMNLVNVPIKDVSEINGTIRDSDETVKAHPEYLYRTDLFEMFYGMISDRRMPLEQALTRGAFAAEMFTKVVEDKQQPMIPHLLKQLKTVFTAKISHKGIDDIQPNPEGKLIVLGELMALVGNHTLDLLRNENGEYDLEAYKRGEENLSKALDGDDFPLRNIALSLLLELSVPFYSEKYSIFENYALFMIAFGAIRLNAVAVASRETNSITLPLAEGYTAEYESRDALWGFASVLSRVLCQSREVADKLLTYLRDEGISKPAALSVMIR